MADLLRVSATSSDELQAVITGLQLIDHDMALAIRRYTREMTTAEWSHAVGEHLRGDRLQSAVLGKTARLRVTDQNVMLQSGNSRRALRGGATPAELARAEEFGANHNRISTYRRRTRHGTVQTVTRHTSRQLEPLRRGGWTVYPAASEIIPRIASLWVQTAMRTIYEAFGSKEP